MGVSTVSKSSSKTLVRGNGYAPSGNYTYVQPPVGQIWKMNRVHIYSNNATSASRAVDMDASQNFHWGVTDGTYYFGSAIPSGGWAQSVHPSENWQNEPFLVTNDLYLWFYVNAQAYTYFYQGEIL